MTKLNEVYKCGLCGNIVEILHPGAGALVCCDERMALLGQAFDFGDQVNLALWVIHNLERMADRVSNICERTVFIATGELFEMDTMDEDDLNI